MLGTGICLPKKIVDAGEIDRQAGVEAGWTRTHTGVLARHFVTTETASWMGARAAERALAAAGLGIEQIDCIVSTSGTVEQLIPCTAVLIQEKLGPTAAGIPCFDINATCLSFLTGLDVLSGSINAGRYRRVLLVATEVASPGLDWRERESCAIIGDGAAAVIIGRSEDGQASQILATRMETYAKGAHLGEIRGGGSAQPAHQFCEATQNDYFFRMQGRELFRMASDIVQGFVERLLEPAGLKISDFALIVPHQASLPGLELMRRRLGVEKDAWFTFAERVGNTVAASIPMGLHFALEQNRLRRGDRVLLLGTAAGFAVGGVALDF
jgi:3-oxoacyl-[acyl-carrier-protein] synthase-3